ncbi:DUF4296 domain-containing protein [Paraflavitalea speifideaquila]|uniref:DUF4296 domain-containing protein n=1 Tax=Paraflavitalea speifideaquila TaxID=3076558 RepID=UPI0028E89128|nr:DUF4296 domain-containing protein [Paraflavitalea speifideiaquila]
MATGLSVFRTLGLVILFVACTNKNKIPKDVVPQEQMEKVMWDMIQADRFSSQFLERDSAARKNIKIETLQLYERVFQIHKITKDEFVHSFEFYLSRPDINRVLFDTLAARANRRRADVYTNPDAPQVVDSVKRVE